MIRLCVYLILSLCVPVALAGDTEATDLRIRKLENTLESLNPLELLSQIEALKLRVNELYGEIEVLQFQLKRQDARIKQLNAQLTEAQQALIAQPSSDQDVNSTDSFSSSEPETEGESETPSAPENTSQTESDNDVAKEQYQAAFELLKESRYQDAIQAFQAFIENHPDSSYCDKAQYWIAETYYIQQDYPNAIEAYQVHLDNYTASPKRSQSKLKLAYSYIESGDTDTGKQTLEQILDEFPGSTAARSATDKIRKLSITSDSE